jgi:hypothetical protein
MRVLFVFALLAVLAGCAPYIPVKDDFGTSALVHYGDMPPEFAEFNRDDPTVAGLLADQICATPYKPLEEQSYDAAGGRFLQTRSRCATHEPFWGN